MWPHRTTCLKDYETILVEALMVRHSFAMFGVHLSSGSGDMTHLIYHVAAKDHMIEGSYDMDMSSSLHATTLPVLVAIGILLVEMF